MLVSDREKAKDQSQPYDVITFDLQSTLPTPRLSTNISFYKRQLMVYNLGIHDCTNEKAYMHVWHEAQASRGAQEVASCVTKFIYENKSSSENTSLITWSDSCGGQNRNIKMSLALLKMVCDTSLLYTEECQNFLESGLAFFPMTVTSVTLKKD